MNQGSLLTSEAFVLGTISNRPHLSNRKLKEISEGARPGRHVQLTMPHVGRGLEHGCQGHLPQDAGPRHLQLPEA